jgi:starch-binding outer membrane protein, SusD/RagB family
MNFKNKFIYLLGGVLALSSCKKQLDQQNPNSFGEENSFQTLEHVQMGVNAAYGRYGAYANNMYMSALLSDEAKLGTDNAGQGALTYRYQFGPDATTGGDITGAYYGYYSMIDQVNRVLPHVATVEAHSSLNSRRNEIKGQLLALRAIGHFNLLESYADRYDAGKPGVPVMVESNVLAKPARNTIGEVVTQIEKDFEEAKTLLPAVTASTFRDTVMNRVNIAAYQARVALYKRDYQKAIDYATAVINSGVKPLASGSAFSNIWTDENSNEVLFRIRYSTSTAIGGMWTTTGGLIYIAPSDKLVASYATGDVRKATYIGTIGGNNYVNKFLGSSRGGRVVDMKAVRIAEMYLIRAEAYAKLSTPNLMAGSADLNALRAARITGYTNQGFLTATDLVNAVLNERFKELAFEGFRFYDLKRNNLPVNRATSDANEAWQTLPATSFRWLLPIPREEIIANPNTVQNTGY